MKKLILLLIAFMASIEIIHAGVQGALPGAFSVSATKKVYFSQGNLLYNESTKIWLFAAHQYSTSDFERFGWGTGNNPTQTTGSYYLYSTFTDWGVNKISNGQNTANLWRTLSKEEWQYLLQTRNKANILYGQGKVNDVQGLIILPDNWSTPSGMSFTAAPNNYTTNVYTISQWSTMEAAGAVFLPARGRRNVGVYSVGTSGYYWTTTKYNSQFCYCFEFSQTFVGFDDWDNYYGMSVRLVLDANKNTYTIKFANYNGSLLQTLEVPSGATPTYTGSTPTRPSTAEYAYTFSGWTPAITAATADKTYTATYTATPRYTITFNANGGLIPTGGNMGNTPSGHITTLSTDRTSGTVVVTKDKTHFQTMTNDCPSREGYTFAGWYTDPTSGVQVYDNTGYRVVGSYWNSEGKWIGTSNVTLYAHWTPIPYTITVNPSNVSQGSAAGGGTYDYGTNHQISATPNECYRFVQWSDGNTDNPRTITVTSNTTYVALFKQIQYEITFVNYDGTELLRTNVLCGLLPTYTETPTKLATAEFTYTFAGWSPSVIEANSNATYTAIYTSTRNKYLIIFQNEDGTELQRGEVEYGQTPAYTGATPTKPATVEFTYTFAGWTPEVVAVTGAATYTATFTATKIIYNIDVTPDDNTEGTVDIEGDPTYGSTITLTATPNDCYHFVRWSDANTDNPRSIVVDGNLSLQAIFEQDNYIVTWQNSDGKTLETDNILCGETPTYDGTTPKQADSYNYQYTFSGWTPTIVPATEDATYIAIYDSTALVPNAENCVECQNAPVVALYDYLLMLNVKVLKAQGYIFTDQDVHWYRVVGEIDNLDAPPADRDDELIATGMYLTIAQNLSGTGNYYVVVDMSKTTSTTLCSGYMRSVLVNYTSAPARHSVALLPNVIRGAGVMTLNGLLPEENTTIAVYDPTGRLIQTFTSTGANEYKLTAVPQQGCYHVRVESETLQTTLKYVVYNE